MKINKLIKARGVIISHAQDKVNAGLAYKMMKFIKASEDDDAFYNDKIKELVEQYGMVDEEGNLVRDDKGNVKVTPEKTEECANALQQLGEIEVETPKIRFYIQEFSETKFSMSELYALDDLLIEEE